VQSPTALSVSVGVAGAAAGASPGAGTPPPEGAMVAARPGPGGGSSTSCAVARLPVCASPFSMGAACESRHPAAPAERAASTSKCPIAQARIPAMKSLPHCALMITGVESPLPSPGRMPPQPSGTGGSVKWNRN
jgi:hypothetical protein